MQVLPGCLLTLFLATFAKALETLPFWPFTIEGPYPHPLDSMILSIALGMAIGHSFRLPKIFSRGIEFSIHKILPFAIILMGARLDLQVLTQVSTQALVINLVSVPIAFFLTIAFCRWAKVDEKLSLLISIGNAICGSAAICAAAPVISAKETQTSLSVTTVTLFGILAIFCYPLLGSSLGMNDVAFGIWAGAAIQALPQVIAAGFSFSSKAGEVALLVKLMRILMLGPAIFLLSLWARERANSQTNTQRWTTFLPPFVLGFLLMMLASSVGLFEATSKKLLTQSSSFLITVAMAAVGLKSSLKGMLQTHLKVLAVGFASAILLGGISYGLIIVLCQ